LVATDTKCALTFALSPGNVNDDPAGRDLLRNMPVRPRYSILMDKAYGSAEMRNLAAELGLSPVVPPKISTKNPWPYDKDLYKKRNIVERLFRRLKAYRRIFTRFDKLDVIFLGFLSLSFIVELLR
jgi:transposase